MQRTMVVCSAREARARARPRAWVGSGDGCAYRHSATCALTSLLTAWPEPIGKEARPEAETQRALTRDGRRLKG